MMSSDDLALHDYYIQISPTYVLFQLYKASVSDTFSGVSLSPIYCNARVCEWNDKKEWLLGFDPQTVF